MDLGRLKFDGEHIELLGLGRAPGEMWIRKVCPFSESINLFYYFLAYTGIISLLNIYLYILKTFLFFSCFLTSWLKLSPNIDANK